MLATTLNEIRSKSPCYDGWTTLLKHLGKTSADDEPLPMLTVLESNGLEDALWVLDSCVDPYICRLFAADCAERVLHLFERERPDDDRPRKAIAVARDPDATTEDKAAAGAAAWDAAWDAAGAAARAAARAAAWDAAGTAARAAARAAAGDSQKKRLRQYLEHGEAAKDMPWAE